MRPSEADGCPQELRFGVRCWRGRCCLRGRHPTLSIQQLCATSRWCHIPMGATSQEHQSVPTLLPPALAQGEAGGSCECTDNTSMQEAAVGRLPGTSYPRRHRGPGWVSRNPAATTTHRTPEGTSPPSSCPYKPRGAGGAQGSLLPSSHLGRAKASRRRRLHPIHE